MAWLYRQELNKVLEEAGKEGKAPELRLRLAASAGHSSADESSLGDPKEVSAFGKANTRRD